MTLRQTMKRAATSVLVVSTLALGLTVVAPGGTAAADPVSFDLHAVAGSTLLPDGTSVPVWGYNTSDDPVDRPGGPVLEVAQGDEVTVNFTNNLGVATGLLFRGQEMVPDLEGVPAGGSAPYTFTATHAGTYLFEPTLLPGAEYQSSMGLYGTLVVHPATPGQAYDDLGTAYEQQAVLVLSEIDPTLNNNPDPASFDMRRFKPKYSLMNGEAYPDTDPVVTTGGSRVLLRYVNAGTQYRSVAALGARQSVIALDGNPLGFSRSYVAETFGPGQTADSIVTAPSQSMVENHVAIYDGSLLLHNSNAAGSGGMLTFLTVPAAPPAGDDTGPVASNVAYDGVTLTATIDETTTGGGNVTAAEYYLDDPAGAPTAFAGPDGTTPSVDVSAAVSVPSGNHVFYVRGQDDSGNWGVFSSVLVDGGDATGPTTRGARVVRNPTNGAADVKLHATADDSQSGKSTIAAAEYSIDGGTPEPMTVNKQAVIASVDAVIPAATVVGLSEAPHEITIRSLDSAGNWGEWLDPSLTFIVDKTGPSSTDVTVAPNPNNGTMPINASTPAIRVEAMITDNLSGPSGDVNSDIRKAEVFIDTQGANGSGIVMGALDGVFDSDSEAGYTDIPLATVSQLSNGAHTLYVHAQDQARNWGSVATVNLLIDKAGPVVTNVTASPNPTSGASMVTLTAEATDTFSDVVAGQWWIGSVSPANRTAMTVTGGGTGLSADIDVSGFTPGSYRIRVRAQDSLGNWGPRRSVLLVVN